MMQKAETVRTTGPGTMSGFVAVAFWRDGEAVGGYQYAVEGTEAFGHWGEQFPRAEENQMECVGPMWPTQV